MTGLSCRRGRVGRCRGVSLRLGGGILDLAWGLHRRWRSRVGALLCGAMALLCTSCLFLAPIEEEEAIPDDPPFFDQVTAIRPGLGTVLIDLDDGGIRAFAITQVRDVNLEQRLYWRTVVDYGQFVIATTPAQILPEQRDDNPITFQYSPCTEPHRLWAREGGTYQLYLLLSDAPFLATGEFFRPDQLMLPFDTEAERPVVWVSWLLRLDGSCPMLPFP